MNHGGYTGLSVATVSFPTICSWLASFDLVHVVAEALWSPPCAPLLLVPELPQAASPPVTTTAAHAATMNRRISPTPHTENSQTMYSYGCGQILPARPA